MTYHFLRVGRASNHSGFTTRVNSVAAARIAKTTHPAVAPMPIENSPAMSIEMNSIGSMPSAYTAGGM